MKKLYDYNAIVALNDKRALPYALKQLEKTLGYKPEPIDVIDVLWNEHFKVVTW